MKLHLRKFVSVLTIFCLFSRSTAFAGLPTVNDPTPEKPFFLLKSLPPKLGTVTDAYEPRPFVSPRTRVIHIQDAHANPDAQKQIYRILRFLTRRMNPESKILVALEGAGGAIRPDYLNFFPGYPKANEAAVRDLFNQGELTGAELFAWKRGNEMPAISFKGVEDSETYRENFKAYRYLSENREQTTRYLILLKQRLEALAATLPAGLRSLILARSRYEEADHAPQNPATASYLKLLGDQAQHLGLDLRDRVEQLRFPNLTRYSAIIDAEAEKGKERASELKILGRQIDLKGFLREQGLVETWIFDLSFSKGHERKLLELYLDFFLLRKLLKLELSRDEYRETVERENALSPSQMTERLDELTQKVPGTFNVHNAGARHHLHHLHQPLTDRAYRAALHFYRVVRRRDRLLLQNALKEKADLVILIAGGFHTDGLKQLMKEQRIPYTIIQPKIRKLPPENLYEKVLNGDHAQLAATSQTKSFSKQQAVFYKTIMEKGPGLLKEKERASNLQIEKTIAQAFHSHPAFAQPARGLPTFDALVPVLLTGEREGFNALWVPRRSEVRAVPQLPKLEMNRRKFEYHLDHVSGARIPEDRQEAAFAIRLVKNRVFRGPFEKFRQDLFKAVEKKPRRLYLPEFEVLRIALVGRYSEITTSQVEILSPAVIQRAFDLAAPQIRKFKAFRLKVTEARQTLDEGSIVFFVEEGEGKTELLRMRHILHSALVRAVREDAEKRKIKLPETALEQFRMPQERDESVSRGGVITAARLVPDPDDPAKPAAVNGDFKRIKEVLDAFNQDLPRNPIYIDVDTLSLLTPSREFLEDLRPEEENTITLKKLRAAPLPSNPVESALNKILDIIRHNGWTDFKTEIIDRLPPDKKQGILLALKRRLEALGREWQKKEDAFGIPYWIRLWNAATGHAILSLIEAESLFGLRREEDPNVKEYARLLSQSRKQYYFENGRLRPFGIPENAEKRLNLMMKVYDHGLRSRTYMALPPHSGYEGSATLAAALIQALFAFRRNGSRGSILVVSGLRVQASSGGGSDNPAWAFRQGMTLAHGSFYLADPDGIFEDQPAVIVQVEEASKGRMEFESLDLRLREEWEDKKTFELKHDDPLRYLKFAPLFVAGQPLNQYTDLHSLAKLVSVFEGEPEIAVHGGVNVIAPIEGGFGFTSSKARDYEFHYKKFSKKILEAFQGNAVVFSPGIVKKSTGPMSTAGRQMNRAGRLLVNNRAMIFIMTDLRKTTLEIEGLLRDGEYDRLVDAVNLVQKWTNDALGEGTPEILENFLNDLREEYKRETGGKFLGVLVQGAGPIGGVLLVGNKAVIRKILDRSLPSYIQKLKESGLYNPQNHPQEVHYRLTQKPMTTYRRLFDPKSFDRASFQSILKKPRSTQPQAGVAFPKKVRRQLERWDELVGRPAEVKIEIFKQEEGESLLVKPSTSILLPPQVFSMALKPRSEVRFQTTAEFKERLLNSNYNVILSEAKNRHADSSPPEDGAADSRAEAVGLPPEARLAKGGRMTREPTFGFYPPRVARRFVLEDLREEMFWTKQFRKSLPSAVSSVSASKLKGRGGIVYEWQEGVSDAGQRRFLEGLIHRNHSSAKLVIAVHPEIKNSAEITAALQQQFRPFGVKISTDPLDAAALELQKSLQLRREDTIRITGTPVLFSKDTSSIFRAALLRKISDESPSRLFVFHSGKDSVHPSGHELLLDQLLAQGRAALESAHSA